MNFLFGDTPEPPNPFHTAAASTSTNVQTAVANAFLNNMNQNTPTGSLSYDVSGTYDWQDPTTGQSYSIPRFTANQSLSPAQQNVQYYNDLAAQSLSNTGRLQADRIGAMLNSGVNVSGAPAAGNAANLAGSMRAPQFSFAGGGDVAREFGDAGELQRSIGGEDDIAGERNRIEAGLMERLNPTLALERGKYEQQLADQGIRYGSPAYENAMRNYSMQANDARLGVIGAAGDEAQRMFSQQAARGEFANQAQRQAYEQAMGRATFGNQAQQQVFNQNAAQASFGNAAAAQQNQNLMQQFNAANVARQQWLDETFALRNQPFNELTALASGSQISRPNFLNTPTSTIPTTDIAGILNNNFNQQMDAYKQNSTNMNSLIGGLFGLGGSLGGAAIRSDRDVKRDIVPMGSVLAHNDNDETRELPIYQYSYKDDPARRRHVGPMAQDVEKLDKRAVGRDREGVRTINLPKLGELLRVA